MKKKHEQEYMKLVLYRQCIMVLSKGRDLSEQQKHDIARIDARIKEIEQGKQAKGG